MLALAVLSLLAFLSGCAGTGSSKYARSVEKARDSEAKIDRNDDEEFAALCKQYGYLYLYDDFFRCHADFVQRDDPYLNTDYFDLSIRFIAAHIEIGNYEIALEQIDSVLDELTVADRSLETRDRIFVDLVSLQGVAYALFGRPESAYRTLNQLDFIECPYSKRACERARGIGAARIATSLGEFQRTERIVTDAKSSQRKWFWISYAASLPDMIFPGAGLLTGYAAYLYFQPVWDVTGVELDYLYGICLLENKDYEKAYSQFRQVHNYPGFDDYGDIYWGTYHSLGRIKLVEASRLRTEYQVLSTELQEANARGDTQSNKKTKRQLEKELKKKKKLNDYQVRLLKRRRNLDFNNALISKLFSKPEAADLLEDAALEDLEKAIEAIDLQRSSFNSMAAKIGYVGSKSAVFSDAIDILVRQGRDAEADIYREKARMLDQNAQYAQLLDTARADRTL